MTDIERPDDRYREHSVTLNVVAWRIVDALGLIPQDADVWQGDVLANLDEACRLIRLGREMERLGA
jgi:hypothetical protein